MISEEDLRHLIHRLEMEEWPKVSAHPEGECLGGDRCAFVARHVIARLSEDEIGDAEVSLKGLKVAQEESRDA